MRNIVIVSQIAFTYVGTVVGAGFATGQEIIYFFTKFGALATPMILLSTILFIWLGTKLMLLAHDMKACSYEDINKLLFGQKIGKWITWFMLFIIIGLSSVMLAGTGSLFVEHFHLSYQLGLVVTCASTYFILHKGISGILQINTVVAPIMISLCILLTVHMIPHPNASYFITLRTDDHPLLVCLSTLLYISFNLALAQAILVPLGKKTLYRPHIQWGGFFGGLLIGFMLLCAHFTMCTQMPHIKKFEIPMGYVALQLGEIIQFIYVVFIFLEIFNTFISNMYGINTQLQQHVHANSKVIYATILLICYVCSQFGFSSLLSLLYPLFGCLTLIWVFQLMIVRPINTRNTQ